MLALTITSKKSPVNYRQLIIEQCTTTLNHAYGCQNMNCSVDHCNSLKRVWKHILSCKNTPDYCHVCRKFKTLVAYHSRQCNKTSCNLVFCSPIRKRRHNISQLSNINRWQQTTSLDVEYAVVNMILRCNVTAFCRTINADFQPRTREMIITHGSPITTILLRQRRTPDGRHLMIINQPSGVTRA